MEIIRQISKIEVFYKDGEGVKCTGIETWQDFDEDESTLTLRFAEFNPIFKRGLVCDIQYELEIVDCIDQEIKKTHKDVLRNLVLVYVNKEISINSIPQYTYVFYK